MVQYFVLCFHIELTFDSLIALYLERIFEFPSFGFPIEILPTTLTNVDFLWTASVIEPQL